MDNASTTTFLYALVVVPPDPPPRRLRRVRRVHDLRGLVQYLDEFAIEGEDLSFEETLVNRMYQAYRRQNAQRQPNGPD